jgi:plastocyanin
MLDLLAGHSEEVVPGSVQVFDMEVVRDTKDTSFNFGTGAMVGTFASLIVGGFMVGAGLNIFAGESTGGEGGAPVAGPAGDVIVARQTKFTSGTSITAPPNTAITLTFDNKDASPPHNVQIFGGSSYSGPLLTGCTAGCEGDTVETPLKGGPIVEEFTFTTPAPGEYAFNCVAHPDQMRGTLKIEEGASIPGAPAAAEGEPGAEASATAAP